MKLSLSVCSQDSCSTLLHSKHLSNSSSPTTPTVISEISHTLASMVINSLYDDAISSGYTCPYPNSDSFCTQVSHIISLSSCHSFFWIIQKGFDVPQGWWNNTYTPLSLEIPVLNAWDLLLKCWTVFPITPSPHFVFHAKASLSKATSMLFFPQPLLQCSSALSLSHLSCPLLSISL